MGSGTTATAAVETGRRYIGFELNKKFCQQSEDRINHTKQQLTLELDAYEGFMQGELLGEG